LTEPGESHDDNDLAPATTEHQFLGLGLTIAKYDKWETYKPNRQIERFKEKYGVIPKTCEMMWADMRVSPLQECKLPKNAKPKDFLLAMRFIFAYDTENDIGTFFDIKSEKTVRAICRVWVVRMKALLAAKMGEFSDIDNELIFIFSIDGTHCPIWEPRPFSTEWSSHKLGKKPAVNYELAIRLDVPKLMWVYGPTRPGKDNDIDVFRMKLKQKMTDELPGWRIIGDKGYTGEADIISTFNEFDTRELWEFKDRAQARHETFNQRLKCYKILSTKFRHGVENHRVAFEACCAVVCYQIESGGTSLFDPYP